MRFLGFGDLKTLEHMQRGWWYCEGLEEMTWGHTEKTFFFFQTPCIGQTTLYCLGTCLTKHQRSHLRPPFLKVDTSFHYVTFQLTLSKFLFEKEKYTSEPKQLEPIIFSCEWSTFGGGHWRWSWGKWAIFSTGIMSLPKHQKALPIACSAAFRTNLRGMDKKLCFFQLPIAGCGTPFLPPSSSHPLRGSCSMLALSEMYQLSACCC